MLALALCWSGLAVLAGPWQLRVGHVQLDGWTDGRIHNRCGYDDLANCVTTIPLSADPSLAPHVARQSNAPP